MKQLELLRKFIADTPKDELKEYLEKFDKMNFGGPTVEEYFKNFNKSFNFSNFENLQSWDEECILPYGTSNRYPIKCLPYPLQKPKIIEQNHNTIRKKDLVNSTRSFFFY